MDTAYKILLKICERNNQETINFCNALEWEHFAFL